MVEVRFWRLGCYGRCLRTMRNATDWLREVSTEELVFIRNITEVINRLSCRTLASQRAADEIRQELDRSGHLVPTASPTSNHLVS